MAVPVDVRRLAAVDMHGAYGRRWRRWVIVAEFLTGVLVGVPLGVVVAANAGGPVGRVLGAWLAGACLNYVPLAWHALDLSRPGRLDRELAGVDIPAALRHYTLAQLWVAVPLLFWWLALRGRPGGDGA
jgi:hypothetical protein